MTAMTAVTSKKLWKPIRNGDIYCSAACGAGCKKVDHDMAQRRAKELAKALGEGWKPHVHENGGWHARATKGKAYIKVNLMGGTHADYGVLVGYTMYFNADSKQFIAHAVTLTEAVALPKKIETEVSIFVRSLHRDLDEVLS